MIVWAASRFRDAGETKEFVASLPINIPVFRASSFRLWPTNQEASCQERGSKPRFHYHTLKEFLKYFSH